MKRNDKIVFRATAERYICVFLLTHIYSYSQERDANALRRNRIGDEGAKYFAEALKINKVKYMP